MATYIEDLNLVRIYTEDCVVAKFVFPKALPVSKQHTDNVARKFAAGTKRIMNPRERQAFLKNSEYGKFLGV